MMMLPASQVKTPDGKAHELASRVSHEVIEGIGHLTLTDAEHRNVLSSALVEEARAAHEDFIASGVRIAVLHHAGPVFCAGRDPDFVRLPGVPPAGAAFIDSIDDSPLLWVAAVDGEVLGAGIHLMTNCAWAVLTDRSSIQVPELDAGIYPRPVGEELASIVGPRRAFQMILTREAMDAASAVRFGLANETIPVGGLRMAVARRVAMLAAIPEHLLPQVRGAWRSRLATRP